jgi:hypothetical protein
MTVFFHRGPIIRSLSIEVGNWGPRLSLWIQHLSNCVNLQKFRCNGTQDNICREVATLKSLQTLDVNVPMMTKDRLISFFTGEIILSNQANPRSKKYYSINKYNPTAQQL